MPKNTKWIIITGGVLSGLGKGIVTASIGRLKSTNLKVVPVKCDGYLNVDPGTMNPYEHGEVFVMDDGGEVDMDFGHYERFMNISAKFDWNLTSGKIFKAVIEKERRGDYLGKTVQMIPHVTDEIKSRLYEIAENEKADVMLVEIGGTVGDIEIMLFLEAVRQLKSEVGRDNILYVHLSLVPTLNAVGEQKTKPTQQTVKKLLEMGIQPDILVCRSDKMLPLKVKEKIALFCNLSPEEVISDPDLETVYELPLIFEQEGLHKIIYNKFKMSTRTHLGKWQKLVSNIKNPKKTINIAICGKYTDLHDSYVSISEALVHAGAYLSTKVNLEWVETTDVEKGKIEVKDVLKGADGIIIPGGFGSRGVEGKIKVITYARNNNIPILGLCYGLQLMVTEFARNVCGLKEASSTENDKKTGHPVIDILPEQRKIKEKGGTMRLGAYPAILKEGSRVRKIYGTEKICERHRHRYEVNPEYHKILSEKGLSLCGMSPDNRLVEFIELPGHKYFIGTQAHPELRSKLEYPAPLFVEFVRVCTE